MANEDKKDFNAMLHDNKDMPKFQTITDPESIEKYGGSKMYFAPPIEYDRVMKKIPYGKLITVIPYYAKFGFKDEGVSDKSTHGNVVWHQMRLVL